MRPSTDLFGKERHDGEDDQGHQNAVGPELQLVAVHPPRESSEMFENHIFMTQVA